MLSWMVYHSAGTQRGRGRPKIRWVRNVTEWSGKGIPQLRLAAVARDRLTKAAPAQWRRHGSLVGGHIAIG